MPAPSRRRVVALVVFLELLFVTAVATYLTRAWMLSRQDVNPTGWIPYLVSLGGTAISVLVALLVYLYSTGEERAARLARRRTQQLAEASAALKTSNRELQHFAYVASHDLRDPLAVVRGYLGLLSEPHTVAPHAAEYVDHASRGAQRMDDVIRGLLDYSRVGRQDRPARPTDLSACLHDAQDTLASEINASGGRIDAEPLPMIPGDAVWLTRLFQNLLGNALKYRHPDRPPRIRITARTLDDRIEIAVADNGQGVPREHRERVFGMFERLDHGSSTPGTGIGLAVCRCIVELHGGRIALEETPGGGATVRFDLNTSPRIATGERHRPVQRPEIGHPVRHAHHRTQQQPNMPIGRR